MSSLIRLRAPGSLLLITTSRAPDVPAAFEAGALTASTRNCVAVGTISEDDREVAAGFVDPQDLTTGLVLAGDFVLDATEGFAAIETVSGEVVVAQDVAEGTLRTEVWVSDLSEPDRVEVVLEARAENGYCRTTAVSTK